MGVDGNAPIWDVGTAMIADSEDELIATLHEGSFEADPWKRFLERLRQAVHANYAGMIFVYVAISRDETSVRPPARVASATALSTSATDT